MRWYPHGSQEGRAQVVRAPLDANYQGWRAVVREEDASHCRNPRPESAAAPGADLFSNDEGMSDTESDESAAGPPDPAVETPDEPEAVASLPRNITVRKALVSLDDADSCAVFHQRAAVMKSFARAFPECAEIGVGRSCVRDLPS